MSSAGMRIEMHDILDLRSRCMTSWMYDIGSLPCIGVSQVVSVGERLQRRGLQYGGCQNPGQVLQFTTKPFMQLAPVSCDFAAKCLIQLKTSMLPKLYVEGSIPFARSTAHDGRSAHRKISARSSKWY